MRKNKEPLVSGTIFGIPEVLECYDNKRATILVTSTNCNEFFFLARAYADYTNHFPGDRISCRILTAVTICVQARIHQWIGYQSYMC